MVLLAGCGQQPPPGPSAESAAYIYLGALKSADYQTCYRMLVEADLVYGSLQGFLGQIPMAPNVERRWFAQIEAATEYRVGQPVQRGAEAIVPVSVITPNLPLWERMLAQRRDTPQSVQRRAEQQLARGNYPLLAYDDRIVMVLEGDEWRLLAGFKQRARLEQIHDQALAAYHEFHYDRALSLYGEMLKQLAQAHFTASGGIAFRLKAEMTRVEQARADASAAKSYLPSLMLRNVEAKPSESGAPGIFGQLVNSGGRRLDQVEVTVSYYGRAGNLLYAEKHTPVALPLEFTDFNLPLIALGPGETRNIGIALKAPFDIQQDNKPQLRVSGVIFSEADPSPPKFHGAVYGMSDTNPAALPGADVKGRGK